MRRPLIAETRSRCPELAEFLEDVCAQPLNFDGPHAFNHSRYNHTHLWSLEWWAERHDWIDLEYRVLFVEAIFARWKGRIKGLPPYRASGYRLYLYQDLAPTVSVVADTPAGCPYGGALRFVPYIRDVMQNYVGKIWSENFSSLDWPTSHEHVLAVIEKNHGSIGAASANALGMKVGELRVLIEQMGLEHRVNDIRKTHKRRPAAFGQEPDRDHEVAIYERQLRAGYR